MAIDRGPNPYRIVGDIAYISLTNRAGEVIAETLVDVSDLKTVISAGRWCRYGNHGSHYVMTNRLHGERKSIQLHRYLCKPSPGLLVDHMNHNGLDNRRANLRVCTNAENCQNRRGAFRNSQTGVRGVHKKPTDRKWLAKVLVNGEVHSSYHDTKEEATAEVETMRAELMPFSSEAREVMSYGS